MDDKLSGLQQRIQSGKPLLLGELAPPQNADPALVRDFAQRCKGKVHAVGVSDNRDRVAMSALAAAALLAGAGVEPILHVVTRDRNRIALVSDALGAQALGIRNLLCTSGSHQTLGPFRAAKNVFDVDPVQLLQTYSGLAQDGAALGENALAGVGPFCLGATASPYATPLELQLMRLMKKITAGAQFIITQPVLDVECFTQWWTEIERNKLHERVAIVVNVPVLTTAQQAEELANQRPKTPVPKALRKQFAAAGAADAQRAVGVAAAVETIKRLAGVKGLRGFQISAEGDVAAALEVIEKSALGKND